MTTLKNHCRLLVLSLVALFLLAFPLSTHAQQEDVTCENDRVEALIQMNNEYIEKNYQQLLFDSLRSEKENFPRLSDSLATQDNQVNEAGEFTTVTRTVQDETPLPECQDQPGLYAKTLVQGIFATDGGGSKGEYNNDPTVSVTLYSTIYYDYKIIDGLQYYRLRQVSGNYEMLDSSIQVTSQSVQYAQSGWSTSTGAINEGPRYYGPSTVSWSFLSGYTNFLLPSDYTLTGANYTVNLKRSNGSSTWSFTLYNHL